MSITTTKRSNKHNTEEETFFSTEEKALQILREVYLKNNGNMKAYWENFFKNRPKPKENYETWLPPWDVLSKGRKK
jgi:hypothetical protein